jgi:Protein of unknown function (DUF3040)
VLSDHERRVLDELERSLAGDVAAPEDPGGPGTAHRSPRRWSGRSPADRALEAVGCSAGLLLVAGAAVAALAIAAAGALSWSLWRYWPVLRDDGVVPTPRWTAKVGSSAVVSRWLRGAWVAQHLKRISEEE